MADAERESDAGRDSATIAIRGTLVQPPKLEDLAYRKDVQAHAMIQVDSGDKAIHEFEIVAHGETARELNRMGLKTKVNIKGRLVGHRWRTAEGLVHCKIEIHADEVTRNGDV